MISKGHNIMAEPTKPMFGKKEKQEETRTSATVFNEDFKMFKALCNLKFDKDPLNNGWKEAVQLFNVKNKDLLNDALTEFPTKKTE